MTARWMTRFAAMGSVSLLEACTPGATQGSARGAAEEETTARAAESAQTPARAPNRILGTWRPVSVRYDPDGATIEPFGPRPGGLLTFSENGTFVEVLHNPDLPRFAAETRDKGTAEENAAAIAGALGIYGTYTVDDNGDFASEVVQGSTFPNWNGLARRRGQLTLTVEGDSMIEDLRDPNRPPVAIVWERVN